ncbi:hypothetical protein CMI47_10275 [Candidatus Pacearchaeota archaeon]|nr:hypothetical protein [Candidatus Pacearchaeota archaeon]|tara:strand:+ start:3800 stop:4030 length:231 start_codon:yes stop_codon:yes gene_type:complete
MINPKAQCPNNPTHNRFYTTAHVQEEWEVDEFGNWIASSEAIQTTHGPDTGNSWICKKCGGEAYFVDVESPSTKIG